MIEDLLRESRAFDRLLAQHKHDAAPSDFPWYPYGTLSNLVHLDMLLTGSNRDFMSLIGDRPMADVGCADGDFAFFLESKGIDQIDLVDYGPTNYNTLRGARALKERMNSRVSIHETDLDAHPDWPRDDYGLVLFLGILYHLKNPFHVLETLARVTRHCVVSTRIARFAADGKTAIRDQSLAYLLGPDECNHDATNYWIFSETGLKRLFERTGWTVLDYMSIGNVKDSDPATAKGDERAFALLKSRIKS
jgi:SAM-dependent methyltransferase